MVALKGLTYSNIDRFKDKIECIFNSKMNLLHFPCFSDEEINFSLNISILTQHLLQNGFFNNLSINIA